jgi:ribonucleotide reductase beta subunit family protein with ferritin-like domain
MQKLPLETPNPLFGLYLYPGVKELMELQQDGNWFAQEIKVENDEHDFRHVMSRDAFNATSATLQLFVEIELKVGDVWEKIAQWFPHSEIEGCAIQFAAMEKSVHAFFYQKMADVLNLDPEEIAEAQQKVDVLKAKLDFLESIFKDLDSNKLLSLAAVTAVEQVFLFSNFAFLKSFGENGHNLIPNTILGVTYVVNDEVYHGELAKYLHNQYIKELREHRAFKDADFLLHELEVIALMKKIIKHEDDVIDYTFASGEPINDITDEQLKIFIRSRANFVLEGLGMSPIYEVDKNPIADWFYRGANSIKVHDFFAGGTNQYSRKWSQEAFSRKPFLENKNEQI